MKVKPQLNPQHKEQRLHWTADNMVCDDQWKNVIWSDEKKFNLEGFAYKIKSICNFSGVTFCCCSVNNNFNKENNLSSNTETRGTYSKTFPSFGQVRQL